MTLLALLSCPFLSSILPYFCSNLPPHTQIQSISAKINIPPLGRSQLVNKKIGIRTITFLRIYIVTVHRTTHTTEKPKIS